MIRARSCMAIAVLVSACTPVWNVGVGVRDPRNVAVRDVTLAVVCSAEDTWDSGSMTARSDDRGVVSVGGMGSQFPPDCDLYVAKPGYRTHKIRYRELCPKGAEHCERSFAFQLVMEPELSSSSSSCSQTGWAE